MQSVLVHRPPIDPAQRYNVDEAAEYLRQSRGKTYKDIAAGRLLIVRDGGRVYVPGTEIVKRSSPEAA